MYMQWIIICMFMNIWEERNSINEQEIYIINNWAEAEYANAYPSKSMLSIFWLFRSKVFLDFASDRVGQWWLNACKNAFCMKQNLMSPCCQMHTESNSFEWDTLEERHSPWQRPSKTLSIRGHLVQQRKGIKSDTVYILLPYITVLLSEL